MQWQLQQAKAQFSRLVKMALEEGPQVVTKHGQEAIVVVDAKEYKRLTSKRMDFKEFLSYAPMDDIAIERSKDYGRDIEL